MYDRSLLKDAVFADFCAAEVSFQLELDQDFDCGRSERPFALGAEAALSSFVQSRKLQQSKVCCDLFYLSRVCKQQNLMGQNFLQEPEVLCESLAKLVQAYIACPSAVQVQLACQPNLVVPNVESEIEAMTLLQEFLR